MDMADRFRGFLPVVVDLETGGFDPDVHAILEIAAVQLRFHRERIEPDRQWQQAVEPFPGARVEDASLKVTGIDLEDPNRRAAPENLAVKGLFREVRRAVREAGCTRAILVAHNAAFDQQFLSNAVARQQIKRSPFHPFSFIDTASLAAVTYGHTVLSEACARAQIEFEPAKAHNALYDAQRTAELFCAIVNAWGRPR